MTDSDQLLIKDLPEIKKPREKLKVMGARNLTNQELIAILLRSGYQQRSALTLARQIVSNQGLQKMFSASIQDLCRVKGIGPVKACTLIACFELAKRCHQELKLVALNKPGKIFAQSYEIKDRKQEICIALYVDGSRRLLKKKTLAIGSLNQNFLEFRELIKPAFNLPAAGIILVHNHPSGDTHPSDQDLVVTKEISQALAMVGVELVDHMIVTTNKYFSMKESGLIPV